MRLNPKTIVMDLRAIERRVIASLIDRGWMDCPQCRQSATNRYNGRHSCNRCGWFEARTPVIDVIPGVSGTVTGRFYTTVTRGPR